MRLIFILVLWLNCGIALANENAAVIAVIVPGQEASQSLKLTPNALKLIYLRKQLYWPSGKRIMPINLYSEHVLRSDFSRAVLGSLPKQQIDYWNGLYFNGIQPPHIVNSEESVIRLVNETPGAVGYVNACLVDHRVKALLWISDNTLSAIPPIINCAQ